MKNAYLIGEKIYLAPIDTDDIPLYLEWLNDQHVTRFLNIRYPLNREIEEEHLQRLIRDEKSMILGIRLKEQDKLIGNVGLHKIDEINRKAIFGIAIGDKTQWAKGYGTEATNLIVAHGFRTLNLNRIELEVFEFNERGIRCYESAGFVREGSLRQAVYRDGRYYNAIIMGLLRHEWEEKAAHDAEITVV